MQELIYQLEPLWGKWKVDGELGCGSFGRVWQVSCVDSKEECYSAVKEIYIPFDDEVRCLAKLEGLDMHGARTYFEEVLTQTLTEIEIMQNLAECNTIVHMFEHQVIAAGEKGEAGWVVLIRMERLVPLKKYLLKRTITVSEVAQLGVDISYALECCEKHSIIHCDIKPDNLFYSPEDGIYKLGDFGVSRSLDRPTAGKGRAGTLTHMPPEVYQGAAFSTASDLYALGMILYRLLNDNRIPLLPPFPKPFTPMERDWALVQRLKGSEICAPSIVHYAIDSTCLNYGIGARFCDCERVAAIALGRVAERAIASDPSKRFSSAEELREAIRATGTLNN